MTDIGLVKQRGPSAGQKFGLQIGLSRFSWTLQKFVGTEGKLSHIPLPSIFF